MPPGSTYSGTVIAVCNSSSILTYRIKLDIKWGWTEEGKENNSHAKRLDEHVIVGNVTRGEITPI